MEETSKSGISELKSFVAWVERLPSHALPLLSLVVIIYNKKAKYSPEFTSKDGSLTFCDRSPHSRFRSLARDLNPTRKARSVCLRSVTFVRISTRLAPYG